MSPAEDTADGAGGGPPPPPAPPAPTVARISKIKLSDYRAFPSGQIYEFDLGPEGKNLLLFGENGSGKTSFFRALRDLAALRPGPKTYADLRNIYTPSEDGFISVEFTAGTPPDFRWDYGDPHPREIGKQPYNLFADRCRFLDYKALLETNFVHRTNKPDLFDLLIKDVLRELPVILNRKEIPLGSVYDTMIKANPADYHGSRKLAAVDKACIDFNEVLKNHLPEIVQEGQRLIGKMGVEGLKFDLAPGKVSYDRRKRKFLGLEIGLSVTFFGKPIEHPQLFLNESRLTALALAIYLGAASLVLKSLTPGSDGTVKTRLLVLDDVLIGLDLANRLPVLRVLNEDFRDWQIILTTYDRVWFELAKIETVASERWVTAEIHSRPIQHEGVTVFDAPLLQPTEGSDASGKFVALAETSLAANDERIAAFYARAALEVKLKSYCHEKRVNVAYDMDGRSLTTDHFLDAIERRMNWGGEMPKALFALNRIKLFRSSVLNPLAHYHPVTIAVNEVKLALEAVKGLEIQKNKVDFMKEAAHLVKKGVLTSGECLTAACWLRTAFEVDLRAFLVDKCGRVTFRCDWAKDSPLLTELWESAKERMNVINAALAAALIAGVEANRRVFLDEWKYATAVTLTKTELDPAWLAFYDAGTPAKSPKSRLSTFA